MRAGAYSRFGDFVEKACERHDRIFLLAVGILLLVLGSRGKVLGKFADTRVAESFTQQNFGRGNAHSGACCFSLMEEKNYEYREIGR